MFFQLSIVENKTIQRNSQWPEGKKTLCLIRVSWKLPGQYIIVNIMIHNDYWKEANVTDITPSGNMRKATQITFYACCRFVRNNTENEYRIEPLLTFRYITDKVICMQTELSSLTLNRLPSFPRAKRSYYFHV